MIWPLVCFSQFGHKRRYLGAYELREDAARAFDKVARVLGRSGLNFPNSDAVEIHGPRSEGADELVAAAVEAARTFVAAGGNNQISAYIGGRASEYTGVHRQRISGNWLSQIRVSPSCRECANQDICLI